MLLILLACFDSADTPPPQPATPAQSAAPGIDGEWIFAEECGENMGGTPVAVYYSLNVTGQTATLHADGYQAMLRLNTDLVPASDGTWTLNFASADPDSMFQDAYQKGAPLLALTASEQTLTGRPLELVLNCSERMVFTR